MAQEVGEVVAVRDDVVGTRAGRARPLATKEAVDVGLAVALGKPASYVHLLLEERVTVEGRGLSKTLVGKLEQKGVGEFTIEKGEREGGTSTGRYLLGFLAQRGSFVLALLPTVAHELTTRTAHATLRTGTTRFRLLVDPLIGTVVATDEGTVTVQALAGGEPVEVGAGETVRVPPGGRPIGPAPVADPEGLPGRDVLTDPPFLDIQDFRPDRPSPTPDRGPG